METRETREVGAAAATMLGHCPAWPLCVDGRVRVVVLDDARSS